MLNLETDSISASGSIDINPPTVSDILSHVTDTNYSIFDNDSVCSPTSVSDILSAGSYNSSHTSISEVLNPVLNQPIIIDPVNQQILDFIAAQELAAFEAAALHGRMILCLR